MELNSAALVGIACFLANTNVEMDNVGVNLSDSQGASIEKIIDSDFCLPQNFERLIEKAESVSDAVPTSNIA